MAIELTQERLKELLSYDPETGVFTWNGSRSGARSDGVAGCAATTGYWQIVVDGNICLAHRLAWLWVYGCLPNDSVDHVNRIKTDNRIANLREATCTENNHNIGLSRRNTSGVKCVYWHAPSSKWVGHIQSKGKRHHIGMFDTIDEAATAVADARAKLHGEFHCHG